MIFMKNEDHVILTIKEIMPSTPKNAKQLVEKGAMDKALKPVYHLTTAEPFWDIEGATLIDLEGKEVTKEDVEQEDANAYVYIPTPETIVRIQNETGLEHVELQLYRDDRHEILNETDRDKVYEDLYLWITENL